MIKYRSKKILIVKLSGLKTKCPDKREVDRPGGGSLIRRRPGRREVVLYSRVPWRFDRGPLESGSDSGGECPPHVTERDIRREVLGSLTSRNTGPVQGPRLMGQGLRRRENSRESQRSGNGRDTPVNYSKTPGIEGVSRGSFPC